MKAKDTVIKETPQISMSFAQLLSKYMALDDFQKIVRADRQAQAEISFKAGIREVVEWIEDHSLVEQYEGEEISYWVPRSKWQEQLKKWEVK